LTRQAQMRMLHQKAALRRHLSVRSLRLPGAGDGKATWAANLGGNPLRGSGRCCTRIAAMLFLPRLRGVHELGESHRSPD
jgi:hypothetical protein